LREDLNQELGGGELLRVIEVVRGLRAAKLGKGNNGLDTDSGLFVFDALDESASKGKIRVFTTRAPRTG
jgi:hypothetical protein